MQLLAKFKQILYMGFRANLNFRKVKVALNLNHRRLNHTCTGVQFTEQHFKTLHEANQNCVNI